MDTWKSRNIDLDTVEALWTLGMLGDVSLPSVATTALATGLDTPALRQLAGLTRVEESEASELFVKALLELGRGKLTKGLAAMKYALYVSREIVAGSLEPYDGARSIWKATLMVEDARFHDLDAFVYAASEYESRPEDRDYFASEIVKEASRLVDRRGIKLVRGTR